jgi:hydrogenase maturation protease
VVGIGSPHGDDRIGWSLAEALGPRLAGLGVTTEVAVTPLDLLELAAPGVTLVVIDASRGAGPAGSVRLVDGAELAAGSIAATSHGYGVVEALRLAEALGRSPARIAVVAVEAESDGPREGLSAVVSGRFTAILDEVEELVRRLLGAARGGVMSGVGVAAVGREVGVGEEIAS